MNRGALEVVTAENQARLAQEYAVATQADLPRLPPFTHLPDPPSMPELPLQGGGGGGTSDGMEQRVARLEKNVDTIGADLATVRADVATLKENVRHLPTKPWMFSTLAGMLAALAVVVGLIVRFIPHAS